MKEIKICLPPYKLAYSLCFAVLLSLVRGVSDIAEIGAALDTCIALLAAVFCADAYRMEYQGKRWEVFCLYPAAAKIRVIRNRMGIQCLYLWLLSFVGYGCFFWQKPTNFHDISPAFLFGIYAAAQAASILFWGFLSMTLSNIFRNIWAGIGLSLILWQIAFSKSGAQLLGDFNVFAFTFRDIADTGDFGWLTGAGAAVVLSIFMLLAVPEIIKKRG